MSKNYKDSEIANPFTDMKPAPETGTSMTAEEGASMIFGGAPTPPVSNTTPALVRLDDSTYSYKRFTLTGKGLAFPDGISLEEADELGHILATLDTHVSLWQGDWANIYVALETAEKGTKLSDQETGRVYIRLADDFSINPKTLKNRASVCRKVPGKSVV